MNPQAQIVITICQNSMPFGSHHRRPFMTTIQGAQRSSLTSLCANRWRGNAPPFRFMLRSRSRTDVRLRDLALSGSRDESSSSQMEPADPSVRAKSTFGGGRPAKRRAVTTQTYIQMRDLKSGDHRMPVGENHGDPHAG